MGTTVRSQRDHYSRTEFLHALGILDATLERAGGEPSRVSAWHGRAAELRSRLQAREARVAVVGPVKSGKSTLVNALLGVDLLPRGAGVLTAQVTAVRRSAAPSVTVVWQTPAEVDTRFSHLLGMLGRPGDWHLAEAEHRAVAAAVAGNAAPAAAALSALLAGYGDAEPLLGTTQAGLPLPDDGLSCWAARDETALFLGSLEVTTPAAALPQGLVLLDCQGYDAWNPCHGAELLAALQQADALVYVVSSRVGLRDADQRLLEQVQGLGFMPLTRFVLNVDWGEVRRPEELARVRNAVCGQVADLGGAAPVEFSALQALLEPLALVDPAALSAGERRLLDAWDADCSAGMADSRERFTVFRDDLWCAAAEERDAVVLRRLRADLRGLLVEVARELRHTGGAGLERAAWEDDAADRVLAWAEQRLAEVAERCRHSVRQGLYRNFAARRAPQRLAWQRAVAAAQAHAGADADPLGVALAELPTSEPLRVNGVRNLALVVRGELARQVEALAAAMAEQLARADLACTPPPSRVTLSRELSVTRRIPLFAGLAAAGPGARAGAGVAAAPRRLLTRLAALGRPGQHAAAAAGRVGYETARALATARLARAWERYLEAVAEECLLPHVEEAAADLYSRLAVWVLQQLRTKPDGWTDVLT